MKAIDFLANHPIRFHSVERKGNHGQCIAASRSEMIRWLEKGSIRINGKYPKARDIIEFPVWDFVLWSKSKNRTTIWWMKGYGMRAILSSGEAYVRVRFGTKDRRGISIRTTLVEVDTADKQHYEATAECSPKDHFVRIAGKKLAGKRVIEHFPKEDRIILWRTICPELFRNEAHEL